RVCLQFDSPIFENGAVLTEMNILISWIIIYNKTCKPQKIIPLMLIQGYSFEKINLKLVFKVTELHFTEGKGLFSKQVIKM
ncbi:hypothetical protein, partial [Peribacillus frigoritolerans]|uniref:hypothetical protein n=1 Tax=Peribacillus castrilensis TaxID=2897690 RepID=UPI003DA4B10D